MAGMKASATGMRKTQGADLKVQRYMESGPPRHNIRDAKNAPQKAVPTRRSFGGREELEEGGGGIGSEH